MTAALRLDDEKTAPFTLGPSVEDARVAVLLLHGFTGSPWEVRPLGEALAARGAHVVCPRLPGHGTTAEAMLFAGHHEWLAAAQEALDALSSAKKLVLAGLSMGGLLAMVLAARRTRHIDGLVLMAPVVKVRSRQARALRRLKFLPVFDLGERWIQKKSTDIEDDAIRATAPLLPRFPLARMFDLFALQDIARDAEKRITCPALVIGAVNDHVVDTDQVMAMAERLPRARGLLLQRGFHIIPRDTDRALALTEISHFIDAVAT